MWEEIKSLRFALGPTALLWAALVLFQLSAFDLPDFGAQVGEIVLRGSRDSTLELPRSTAAVRGRVLWAADIVLFFACAGATGLMAWTILRANERALRSRVLWFACAVLIVMELVAGLSGLAPAFVSIHLFPADALATFFAASEPARAQNLVVAAFTANLLGALVPALAIVAGCVSTLGGPTSDASELAKVELRMRRLDQLLHLGSALLGTGILHLFLWLRMPADLVGANQEWIDAIQSRASTVSLFWGTVYSALIAAWYLPISRALAASARDLVECNRAAMGVVDVDKWLKERGLLATPLGKLPQFAAMLGPLLAGPVGALFSELVKSVG